MPAATRASTRWAKSGGSTGSVVRRANSWAASLLGAVPEAFANYVTFHAKVIGCRYCQANLIDLQSQQAGREPIAHSRRRKYFQSSAGYLKKEH